MQWIDLKQLSIETVITASVSKSTSNIALWALFTDLVQMYSFIALVYFDVYRITPPLSIHNFFFYTFTKVQLDVIQFVTKQPIQRKSLSE